METMNANHVAPSLALFRGEPVSDVPPLGCPKQSLPIDEELISLFESITGWVMQFQESRSSQRLRARVARHNVVKGKYLPPVPIPNPEGTFVISDMSVDWPASRPTSHRGKCDRFVELFSDMVAKLQRFEKELSRYQSASLAAESLNPTNDDLVDSFAPRYPYQTECEIGGEFELSLAEPIRTDCIFVERQVDSEVEPFEPSKQTTQAPFYPVSNQWQIGGQRGFHGNRYIDWVLLHDQRIELVIGQIECPENGANETLSQEWRSKLTINPATKRYWLADDVPAIFWLLDHATHKLTPITRSDKVHELNPAQSIILTTATIKLNSSQWAIAINATERNPLSNADDLALVIQDCFCIDEPVLVLSRY
jgi:hypothetical protein